jgi:hypothetical protein
MTNQNENTISHKKDFWSRVIGWGHLGLALFFAYQGFRYIFRSEITIWRCGNCHIVLAKKYEVCPFCGEKIKWNKENGAKEVCLELVKK